MTFDSLEDAVFKGKTLADPVRYVRDRNTPNALFYDGEEDHISVLHIMVMMVEPKGVSVMLNIGADPNLKTQKGVTPLSMAILKHNTEIIELLVGAGADVNARDETGSTPLHSAMNLNNEEVAGILVMNGADLDALNSRGITPKQIYALNRLRACVPGLSGGARLGFSLLKSLDEGALEAVLLFCEASLPPLVHSGRLTRVKAQALNRKIEKFRELCAEKADTRVALATKQAAMWEIVREIEPLSQSSLLS